MLFDWFTIIAQIINFLILLFLLRRFLYRPILNSMEAREKRIANLLESAEQKRQAAEQEHQRFEAKNEEWDANVEERQREMEISIENWRKDALRDARQDVDQSMESWSKTIEDHKTVFLGELNQFAVRQTYTIARRAIQDLAGTDLETMMVNAFLENLKRQDLNLEQLSNSAGQKNVANLKLRSAFELPSTVQHQLQNNLQNHFRKKITLQFETAPDLISGIELVGESGYTAAWNLRRYLETLQDELDQQINAHLGERSPVPDQVEAASINDQ